MTVDPDTSSTKETFCCNKSKLIWGLKALCLGQILALCNALLGIFNELITKIAKEPLPACQTALNYLLLCLTWGIVQLYKNQLTVHRSKVGLKCLVVAVIDVEAWHWIYSSYQLTSLTSVQSLDCLSIPVALIITRIFMGRSYSRWQYGAILLSTLGVLAVVYSDYDPSDTSTVQGDLMCAAGAVLFGVSTVCQEWLIKELSDVYQYIGTMCWYAASYSLLKAGLLEGATVVGELSNQPLIALVMLAMAITQFVFYSVMPIMLDNFGAGSATVNILTADVYAAVAGLLLFNMHYGPVYILGMGVIVVAILVYTLTSEEGLGNSASQRCSKCESDNSQSDPSEMESLMIADS